MEIEGHHSEVEVNTDRIIGKDHITSMIIEMTLEKTILEKCRITEVKIWEVDIEGIIEMTTLEEVEVGLDEGKIQVILAEMMEIVVGQNQVQELVLMEIELDALGVGNIIITLKDCPNLQTEKEPEWVQQMYNLDDEQTAFKVLARDMYDNLIRTNSDNSIVDHLIS